MGVVLTTLIAGLMMLFLFFIVRKVINFIKWHKKMVRVLSHFPGPKPHWFFGNVLEIESFHEFFERMMKKYVEDERGKAYVFWIFLVRPVLILTHPDTIKIVMKSLAPKSKTGAGIGFLRPWIGDSLLLADGPKWERNRRLLTPAFHFSVLNGYFSIYNEVADTMIDKLADRSKRSKYVEVFQTSSLATLDSLLQCALSYKEDIQSSGENHPYVNAVQRVLHLMLHRCKSIHLHPEFLFRLSPSGKEFFRLCDYLNKTSTDIINKRRRDLIEDPDSGQKKHKDFLDILLTAKDENGIGLTDEEIRYEVNLFMFAGHDTTASALSWSIYCLGKYKHIQDKVYTEVREVVGNKHCIDGDDISKMPYLGCFLKEVMRQHTPVPVVSRMLDEPCVVDGVELPEGTFVDLAIHQAHHHPDVWEDPWEFKPERFEDDKQHEMDPYSFTPFSAGPRNCIGQMFAKNEEKVFIARLVNRFEISLDPEHVVEHYSEAVMRAKNGIMASFKERTNST